MTRTGSAPVPLRRVKAVGEGTRVTCTDVETGESESVVIRDDYLLITDGRCYLDGVQTYANGTAVLTVKRRAAEAGEPR